MSGRSFWSQSHMNGGKELMDKEFYSHIKEILSAARAKAYSAVNFAMVEAYWEI